MARSESTQGETAHGGSAHGETAHGGSAHGETADLNVDVAKPEPIVVGVDGSQASKAALRWAAGQAELTGVAVHAVLAWEYPIMYGWGAAPVGATVPPANGTVIAVSDLESAARQELARAVDEALGPGRSVPVVQKIAMGSPAQVLLDEAGARRMLVVGRRGHGGFRSALLGSVSQHCVHHAAGPVVVIHADS